MKFTKFNNIFLARRVGFIFAEYATKLRSKIVVESQDFESDAAEAAHEGIVLGMVERIERRLESPQLVQ